MDQNLELLQLRKKQAFIFNLKRKYSKLLEFDKTTRTEWRLTNFAKKKVLFTVCNLSDSEIKEIDGLFRYRCYLCELDDTEVATLNSIFEAHMEAIKYEKDDAIRSVLLDSLMETRKQQMRELLQSSTTLKFPVMLDLRIYGPDPSIPVMFNDKLYELDEITKENIKASFERINPATLKGERFKQMLNHSKILRDSYDKEINPQPALKIAPRELQKATNVNTIKK